MIEQTEAARAHKLKIKRLQLQAIQTARAAWGHVYPAHISETWRRAIDGLAVEVAALQVQAAAEGSSYGAHVLAERGTYRAPEGFLDLGAFAGTTPDGRSLKAGLYSPAVTSKRGISGGLPVLDAHAVGGRTLDRLVASIIADTARQAAGADLTLRPGVGYIRRVILPACSRCILLAGRRYRWNSGFLRHPQCDCVHEPATVGWMRDADTNPYNLFTRMSDKDQDAAFGKHAAQAIRDGADMGQVVNARRGMSATGLTTRSGMTRGHASTLDNSYRLTPEGIYRIAASRAQAVEMLKQHGYIVPGGQVPTGALIGQRQGFGELGRGGRNVFAVRAVLEADIRDQRDPGEVYTMTAAEYRLYRARHNWTLVLAGENPYEPKKPLTPEAAARAESEFRRWTATGGEVFVR